MATPTPAESLVVKILQMGVMLAYFYSGTVYPKKNLVELVVQGATKAHHRWFLPVLLPLELFVFGDRCYGFRANTGEVVPCYLLCNRIYVLNSGRRFQR